MAAPCLVSVASVFSCLLVGILTKTVQWNFPSQALGKRVGPSRPPRVGDSVKPTFTKQMPLQKVREDFLKEAQGKKPKAEGGGIGSLWWGWGYPGPWKSPEERTWGSQRAARRGGGGSFCASSCLQPKSRAFEVRVLEAQCFQSIWSEGTLQVKICSSRSSRKGFFGGIRKLGDQQNAIFEFDANAE